MIYSLHGKIVARSKDTIAIDIGSIGYEVFVARPEDFMLGDEKLIYTCEIMTQDDHYLVGFATLLEKAAFQSLVSVKGIGPKTALSALSKADPEGLFQAISNNNVAYLKKLPGIGPKAAAQIVLDLRGKIAEPESAPGKKAPKGEAYEEAAAALKSLGFKAKDIDDALATVDLPKSATTQEVLKLALRKLRKQ